MLTRMKWLGVVFLCVMAVGLATPVAAQDTPRVEVSGGYNWVAGKASEDDVWSKFPKGWYVDLAGNVTPILSIVGQVSGNYKTFEDPDENFDLSVHPYLVGIRGSSPGRVRGFGQFLIGGAKLKGTQDEFSASENTFAIELGGGVNIMGSGNVGARVGLDYLRFFAKDNGEVLGGENVNAFRFSVGLVIGFGSR